MALIIVYNLEVYIHDELYELVQDPKDDDELIRLQKDPHGGNDTAFLLLIGIIYSCVFLFIKISKIGIV